MKNMFCNSENLRNESDVEQFFIIKLISYLGFKEENIFTKKVLTMRRYGKGLKKTSFIPDYQLNDSKTPLVIVEAKSPEINVESYVHEAQEYASVINRDYIGSNPIKFCITSNGNTTYVHKPDERKEILKLSFSDFTEENEKFKKLVSILSFNNLRKTTVSEKKFEFKKPEINELRAVLYSAHNKIRSAEKIGPKKAFYEFSKLLFIKMNEDKRMEEKINNGENVSIEDFAFSTDYIDKQSKVIADPINNLFTEYRSELERLVAKGEKKRIFKENETINLKPSTIRSAVELIQNYNLKSVEDDINGKVFETFLESSVRGKELGQFFTPRSVVKFIVKLANLKFHKNNEGELIPDKIIDGSCGTGGFLIFALSDLFQKIPDSLTDIEKNKLKERIKKDTIYGVDASDDDIVPITRMNMYLHGDGGSHIFLADTLDKDTQIEPTLPRERQDELKEFKSTMENIKFDVVLTNPPFSMKYNSKVPEENRILEQYDIRKITNKNVASLKSNIMFLERYYDILKPGGKLITVIDESVLNTEGQGKHMLAFRSWLMDHYIIRAIISLPKNTFVNQDAGVKTSVIYLTKKISPNEQQSKTFMAISADVGHNDAGRSTSEMGDLELIYNDFLKFERGELND